MDSIERLGEAKSSTAPARRACVLVLGMHRSGTSALTRILSIAGAQLPADLLGASHANEAGHWESRRLFEYHDRMLAEFGSAWDDWRPIDLSRLPLSRRSEITNELSEILVQEFGDAPLIVVKDPRICRFAPLFFAALETAGFDCRSVVSFRSPLEVAESLERRDDMSRSQAGLLWLRHVLDAEFATRGKPRVLVSYDSVLADWQSTLSRLGSQLSISWPYDLADIEDQVDAFLSPSRRNHKSTMEQVLLDPMLSGWMSDVYSALLMLERNSSSAKALETIERVRREFAGATPILDRLSVEAEARRVTSLAQANRLAEEAETAAVAAREEAERLASEVERRDAEMAGLAAELVTKENANAELVAYNAKIASEKAQHEAQAARQAALIAQQREDLARRLAAYEELSSALAQSKAALSDFESIQADLRDREAQLESVKARLSQYERPGFRDNVVRPFAHWFLEDEFSEDIVEREKFVDWLLPTFQGNSDAESWTINAGGAELAELMKLVKQEPDEGAKPLRPDAGRTKSILLVSEYAPSFAHAGGLRVRDIYAEIKRLSPATRLSLYCPAAPEIDGDINWLGEVFDDVYLTRPADFAFVDFVQKAGGRRRYDVVDSHFHRAGRLLAQFSQLAERTLFTPMECLARSTYEQTRTGFRRDKTVRVRDIASLIRSTLDELRIVTVADETVCVSDADAAFLQKLAPWRRVDSIPTGLSDSEFAAQLAPDFRPAPPSAKPKRLVYAAYFGSDTNRVGLSWFLDHVHPHVLRHCPDYKLAVVGRGDLSAFIERKPENVTFIGEVPVMPPVLEQARAGLVLALHGSGFRGKINQYAACGLPSISTSLGITGLAYTPGVDIETADDPHEFALACVRVLNDDAYADQLAARARTTALDNYRWDKSHDKIRQIYRL